MGSDPKDGFYCARDERLSKINYAIYGDLVPHLHYHVVPKYRGGPNWGEPFALQPPAQRYLTEEGYSEVIGAIETNLPA